MNLYQMPKMSLTLVKSNIHGFHSVSYKFWKIFFINSGNFLLMFLQIYWVF